MKIPTDYQIALLKMMDNKKVRLNSEGRAFWCEKGKNLRSDVWNYIMSVNYDDTVNLCSTGHLIRENVPFSHIAW